MDIGVWQGGDGKRYMVNAALWFQVCAATAAIDAKNKFSKVETTGVVKSAIGSKSFEHVSFDREAAETYRKGALKQYYNDLWNTFQAPRSGSGAAVVAQLVHLRDVARRCSESLDKKFGRASDTNKENLTALDNQLLAAQVVRDTGFTTVIALSTGGIGAVGSIGTGARVLIAGGAIISKAGTKVYDIRATVTDQTEKNNKYGSVILGTGMDVLFSGISLGRATMTVGESMLIAATIKAPAEAAKTALDGGTATQIAFATGFEAFAPITEGLGAALAGKLFPRFAGEMAVRPMTKQAAAALETTMQTGGQVAGQGAAAVKDGWILPWLGMSTQGTSKDNHLMDLISLYAAISSTPADYYRKHAIHPI